MQTSVWRTFCIATSKESNWIVMLEKIYLYILIHYASRWQRRVCPTSAIPLSTFAIKHLLALPTVLCVILYIRPPTLTLPCLVGINSSASRNFAADSVVEVQSILACYTLFLLFFLSSPRLGNSSECICVRKSRTYNRLVTCNVILIFLIFRHFLWAEHAFISKSYFLVDVTCINFELPNCNL